MRWLIIIIFFISCTDNQDEEMKLFYTGLNTNKQILPENGVRVFILTGQSNAYGRALNSDATSSELQPQTQLKIWSKINTSFEDLDIGSNNLGNTNEHSIELGLAKNFNTYYPNEMGYLIKWAVSSTPIRSHLSGGSVYTELWNNYVKPAINNLINSGKVPYVYFIYSQGERDANPDTDGVGDTPAAHYTRFGTLIDLWRSNIGNNLPFVAYETLDFYSGSLEVNANMLAYESLRVKYKMLPMVNETDIGDGLHFDYQAHKNASIKALDFFALNQGQPVTELIP